MTGILQLELIWSEVWNCIIAENNLNLLIYLMYRYTKNLWNQDFQFTLQTPADDVTDWHRGLNISDWMNADDIDLCLKDASKGRRNSFKIKRTAALVLNLFKERTTLFWIRPVCVFGSCSGHYFVDRFFWRAWNIFWKSLDYFERSWSVSLQQLSSSTFH